MQRPTACGRPDGLWFVWEAKTAKKSDGLLDAEEVRQAETHPRWVERVLGWARPAKVATVIVMPTPAADAAVADVGGEQWVVATSVVRALAADAADVHRTIRGKAAGLDDLGRAAAFAREWSRRGLDTESLVGRLTTVSVTAAAG